MRTTRIGSAKASDALPIRTRRLHQRTRAPVDFGAAAAAELRQVSACQSFEITVSETTLSGNASKLKVTFAKARGSRGNHEDVVDALSQGDARGSRPASRDVRGAWTC